MRIILKKMGTLYYRIITSLTCRNTAIKTKQNEKCQKVKCFLFSVYISMDIHI